MFDAINEDWCDNEIKSMAEIFVGYSFKIIQKYTRRATLLVNRGCFIEGLEILYKYSEKKRCTFLHICLEHLHTHKNHKIKKFYKNLMKYRWFCEV